MAASGMRLPYHNPKAFIWPIRHTSSFRFLSSLPKNSQLCNISLPIFLAQTGNIKAVYKPDPPKFIPTSPSSKDAFLPDHRLIYYLNRRQRPRSHLFPYQHNPARPYPANSSNLPFLRNPSRSNSVNLFITVQPNKHRLLAPRIPRTKVTLCLGIVLYPW